MEYKAERQRLYRSLVVNGTRPDEFNSLVKKEGVAAPEELIAKWQTRFFETQTANYPTEPRLINRFMVGADPEFVFSVGGKYKHAESLGLNTLDAFGCDMSGRQAELRAYPSRFVLEVVASLVDTVRWMCVYHRLGGYDWLAPAFFAGDGIGGHIHFGRKRPDLEAGVKSLDCVTQRLLDAGVLDWEGQKARRSANGRYGAWGDWRAQVHGYEYRTMPSWMTSPWAAYFTLTVAKLAVLDDVKGLIGSKRPMETLVNLLRAYKGKDDDARIALMGLERQGFPKFLNDDFKTRWGVDVLIDQEITHLSHFAPPVIQGTPETCKQLYAYLTEKKPLPLTRPKPNWSPFQLPAGVSKMHVNPHVAGISDVAQGLLVKDGLKATIFRGDRHILHIRSSSPHPYQLSQYQEAAMKYPELREVQIVADRLAASEIPYYQIYVPKGIYDEHLHATDKALRTALRGFFTESGLFPFVKYTELDKPVVKVEPVKKKRPKPIGHIVSSVIGALPEVV